MIEYKKSQENEVIEDYLNKLRETYTVEIAMTSRMFLILLCLFGIFVNTHTLNPQLINEVINGDFNSFEDQNFLFRDFFSWC